MTKEPTRANLYYQQGKLALKTTTQAHRIVRTRDTPLAFTAEAQVTLVAVDRSGSSTVLFNGDTGTQVHSYTPYGHDLQYRTHAGLIGFNGEPVGGGYQHYLLGGGYRSYHPGLMRFSKPDEVSPFREGGLNCYAYCQCDPINFTDDSGHAPVPVTVKARVQQIVKLNKKIISDHTNAVSAKKTAAANIARLDHEYSRVDIHYGLDQKTRDGSKVNIHPSIKEKAAQKKTEIINQLVIEKDNLSRAQNKIDALVIEKGALDREVSGYQQQFGLDFERVLTEAKQVRN